jgi:raffinose/stachyose/melibiose transport system permease protein
MDKSIKKVSKAKQSPIFFAFLFPAVFAFFMVIIIPFFIGLYYSFTDWMALTYADVEWVGIKNYLAVFQDVTFLNSFIITTVYAILSIIILNLAAFFLALLVTSGIRHTGFYRAGFFMPNLIGGLILGYIWQFIFNRAVPAFGKLISSAWLSEHLFLADRNLALLAIVIVGTWQYAGYLMMIYVASIQSIPTSLLEAAEIDGANTGHRLRYITFPLVAPAFTVCMFLTLVNSFKQFDVNFALTNGGPSGMFMGQAVLTNQFLALNIFQTAFSFRQLAEGQAKAIIFFVAIVILSLIQVQYNKRKEVEM